MNSENDNTTPGGQNNPFMNIISGYLWGIGGEPIGHYPGTFNPKHVRVITSQEIVLELADMVDIELNDVAGCMTQLGYICGSYDGKLGWFVNIKHS